MYVRQEERSKLLIIKIFRNSSVLVGVIADIKNYDYQL